ncbi:BppU family phage baseplate upper protein [Enterococcus faecalis]|nr:BppU family phage baseplate upper protein [Enterococcus faecalis]
MANKILNLDFSKDPIMPPIIYGRVGDEKMQTITVKISRRDEIPDLSGGIITFEGEPAGGKVKVFDSENVSSTSSGLKTGTFEYTFPSAAFSIEGTYKRAYFSFQKDGKRDTTGDFKIIVKGNADIDAEEAETIITEYNKLVTALNEAYQAALKKIDTDYDAVVARIESIKKEMNALQAKIDKTVSDAEGRISKVATDSEAKINTTAKTAEANIAAIGKSVTEELNKALQELHAADFYTRSEAEAKFAGKGETYTKQESDGKYVDLFGRQEIAGTKDFMNPPKIAGQTVISEKVIAFSAPNTVSVSGTGVKAISISQKVITNNEFFELSANKIKVLKDGIISVVTSYTTNVPAGWCNIELTKNNAVMNRSNQGTGGLQAAGLTDVFDVKAGDTIAFQSNSNQSSYSILYLRGFLRYLT